MFEDKVLEEKCPQNTPILPPMPPLQRAPNLQYKISPTSLTERTSGLSEDESLPHSHAGLLSMSVTTKTPVRLLERRSLETDLYHMQETAECDGVSKLVMKNVSRGAAKKKALIHSIPKFSQVLPNQQLAEAQRVLQERLLQKKIGTLNKVNDALRRNPNMDHMNNNNVDLRASSMLQTIVDLSTSVQQQHRPRRERKPRKTEICHIRQGPNEEVGKQTMFPEVTITRRISPPASSPEEDPGSPLDLTTRQSPPTSCNSKFEDRPPPLSNLIGEPPPLVPNDKNPGLPYSLVLKPEDYETLALKNPLYATYIFLPSVGVFVHPLAIPPELAPASFIPLSASSSPSNLLTMPPATSVPNFPSIATLSTSGSLPKRSRKSNHTVPEDSHHSFSQDDNQSAVSMCKFKFTGGTKPSLEEKKMLSVDSEGNLKYKGSHQGPLQGEMNCKPTLTRNNNFAAIDVVGVFDSMGERGGQHKFRNKVHRSMTVETSKSTGSQGNTLITTNQTSAGDGSTFCTFKNIKTVGDRNPLPSSRKPSIECSTKDGLSIFQVQQ